jgi:sugar lactone lactonase YvrE
LTPDGKTLYWQAIKGKTLYSLPTSALNPGLTTAVTPKKIEDNTLRGKVEIVGENGPADGLIISRHDGRMYVTGPQTNSIGVRDLAKKGGKPTTVLQDDKLHWPDTFSEGADGTLFFRTSHIQNSAFFNEGAPIALPTELWNFMPTK